MKSITTRTAKPIPIDSTQYDSHHRSPLPNALFSRCAYFLPLPNVASLGARPWCRLYVLRGLRPREGHNTKHSLTLAHTATGENITVLCFPNFSYYFSPDLVVPIIIESTCSPGSSNRLGSTCLERKLPHSTRRKQPERLVLSLCLL